MKLNAFKISQDSNRGKNFQIFLTKVNIFDLKDFVYVKRIEEDYKELKYNYYYKKLWGDISGINGESLSNNRLQEVQRKLMNGKLKGVESYLKEDLGIFPSSILLGSKNTDRFLVIKESQNDFYTLEFNDKSKGFFVIDGQHRIFGLLKYIKNKIKDEFYDIKFNYNDIDNINSEINYMFELIGSQKAKKFKEENKFELPVVIMHEISVDLMVELFADINDKATGLDRDFSTYIYGVATNKDYMRKIFVSVGEGLNNNENSPLFNRINLPYKLFNDNLETKKYSKISINPFYTNSSKLLTLTTQSKKIDYFSKPLNLLLDNFVKNSEYTNVKSPETLSFIINGIIILYFCIFDEIKLTYGKDNYLNEKFNFINTNNLSLYLYIIKIVIIILYIESIEDNSTEFIKSITEAKISEKIKTIFNSKISSSLKGVYDLYGYFGKGVGVSKSTGASKGDEILTQFKVFYYKIEMPKDKNIKDLNNTELQKIKKLIKEKELSFKKEII